ncbi:jasmonic acid-amido synthetase JAR1 isoform X1 [Iris pallida]|uniref:Jasmonic acid-amido synthetase JAR1 isoform X1 n=1 Tax=Iris pallida TaxID=29817 RepID=A0AAX6I2W0_IRIPA|nr:jasmonic acid-amido synthetase JAR1 isoform X1 [Iris pallida]
MVAWLVKSTSSALPALSPRSPDPLSTASCRSFSVFLSMFMVRTSFLLQTKLSLGSAPL